ncbi:FAD-dependent monooxygenase [Streptomyces sp. NBC_01803]|uniref:FAD-dependent monooxygenase n=1 Tax=Streptomyces sp. NBC_01803 TaxID=2975946 RepID=UPI002DDA1988|nr:FAD-dependent monooxygenase [Streptomyces sp. NBC_01803]WSA43890.1 FAD-dependent monooxygenase [Streptomyces sp. NBC_01803]
MLPVIIAGAGPVGLALALALAGHGVPTVVLDGADGPPPSRLARTCVLPHDVARWAALPGVAEEAAAWLGWRATLRGRTVLHEEFAPGNAPRHVPQHVLHRALRDAAVRQELVRLARGHRLTDIEQRGGEVVAHTVSRAPDGRREQNRQWRGSHLVGCDGARSTVRKLLGIPFHGRTGVARYAVAALRAELPRPEEAGLHRGLPVGEVTARPLTGGRWRLDWPLPPDDGLVTPESLLDRVHATLAAWHGGEVPAYDLLDTGVHICHQRLARSWRTGRVFLAGDAAHLVGALGTQQVGEGLRDVDNLAWKLAVACHEGHAETLLDSYQAERRTAVGVRLRAVDQALPLARGRGGLSARLTGRGRGRLALLTDGHLGRGALGAPARYAASPIASVPRGAHATDTPLGAPTADVPVIALDGSASRLRDRLGGPLLLVLTAPGAGVWDAKHWLSAGLMPELAAAARTLPLPAEVLVTEEYPGAGAHTLLVVRPDGHLAAALAGTDQEALRECVRTLRGASDEPPSSGPGGQEVPPAAEPRATGR